MVLQINDYDTNSNSHNTIIVIVGMGLIMQQQSQNVAITQKENAINAIHNTKEKETIQATHSGSRLVSKIQKMYLYISSILEL